MQIKCDFAFFFVYFQAPQPNNCNNFLSTVSRIVSSSEPMHAEPPKVKVHKPKVLHMAAWIHAISLAVTVTLGWIDMMPGTGPVSQAFFFFLYISG